MQNDKYDPLTVPQARGAVAGLFSRGAVPDPSVLEAARAALATSMLDREIRMRAGIAETTLDDVQVGHLVGLLLATCGVGGSVVMEVESLVRRVVVDAHGGDQ